MGKRWAAFLSLAMALLFAFGCVYSLFDLVQEVDFLSGKKYENQDIKSLNAQERSNPHNAFIPTALFSSLPDTFREFLPGFFSLNTLLVTTFSVLRC